jgi:hypothetical protein
MEQFCPRCGFAAPVARRSSTEGIDDISPGNYSLLEGKSNRLATGSYKIHSLERFTSMLEANEKYPLAAYKDTQYRNSIARRYGIALTINSDNFWTPYLLGSWDSLGAKSIFEIYKEKWK